MEISFSRKELSRLIELAYMGHWVATANDEGNSAHEKRYGDLMQKLYKAASGAHGCPEYVCEGGELFDEGELLPAERLEEDSPASAALGRYDNETFWDTLIERLAERDYERELARVSLPVGLSEVKRERHADERTEFLEERYRDEFVKNDLANVIVLFGTDRLS